MNNKFSLYWYRSLAETLDTTYINKQGFPTKRLFIFNNNDTYSQYYLTYVVVTLIALSLIYYIKKRDLLNRVYNLSKPRLPYYHPLY